MVTTVTGEVSPENLGVTLMHEHLLHRISISSLNADNTSVDRDVIVQELIRFKSAGGDAICDVTPMGLGCDPLGLREVSRQSGVKIIYGIGLYMENVFPEEARGLSKTKLANYIVRCSEKVFPDIQAGIIGEVASHNENHCDWRRYRLTMREKEFFFAVANAQKRTGLSISTHASIGRAGIKQVHALLEGQANPKRIIVGHCDAQWHVDVDRDLEYYHTLLDKGVNLSFDLFSWQELMPDEERFKRIELLVRGGFSNRILLSTDTCRRSQLHCFGGRGLDYIFSSIIPGLQRAGIRKEDIHNMTVLNPRRLLSREN